MDDVKSQAHSVLSDARSAHSERSLRKKIFQQNDGRDDDNVLLLVFEKIKWEESI